MTRIVIIMKPIMMIRIMMIIVIVILEIFKNITWTQNLKRLPYIIIPVTHRSSLSGSHIFTNLRKYILRVLNIRSD